DLIAEMQPAKLQPEKPTLRPRPQMVTPEREGPWEGWVKPSLKQVGREVVGGAETAMSLASGMAMYIPGKIAGSIGSAIGEDPRLVEEWLQTEFLPVYQPYTEAGQRGVMPVSKLFENSILPLHYQYTLLH
ncbi:unnamed protein product, partial [marine sediment metagenome]